MKSGVRFTPSAPARSGRRIFHRHGQVQVVANWLREADLRLPEQRDGIQAFEVDANRFGLGIRERGPGLTYYPAPRLHERVAQPDGVAGAGKVPFDEHAHVTEAARRP
jgi:hypothetical protein